MKAPGFCRCGAELPWNATWCFTCDKPVLPQPSPAHVPTGTGWPVSA
jgi:hypothetical protein